MSKKHRQFFEILVERGHYSSLDEVICVALEELYESELSDAYLEALEEWNACEEGSDWNRMV
ncbi:MAG: hypothetical protein ACKO48_08850 [Actinomycetota bacterium]